jgi:hypothetical protein
VLHFRYVKNHHHIQHLSYRSVSRLTTPLRGVGVEVLDHTMILRRVPILGILNPGKHCMTSQQVAMMRYVGCNSWLHLIFLNSNASFPSLMGASIIRKNTYLYSEIISWCSSDTGSTFLVAYFFSFINFFTLRTKL